MKRLKHFSVKNALRALSFGALLGVFCFGVALADEYQKALEKFLETSQTNAALNQLLNDKQALDALYKEYGNKLSNKQKQQIAKAYQEYINGAYNDMMAIMPSVYKKYLSLSDLQELTKFYQTPLGKKLAKMQFSMVNEDLTPIMIQILQKHLPVFQEKFQAILQQ